MLLHVLNACHASLVAEFEHLVKISNQQGALSKSDVGDHFEQRLHLNSESRLYSQSSKPVTQLTCSRAILQSLAISSSKLVGFQQLTQHVTPTADRQLGLVGFKSPLVVLLRRVSIWYYYHVMYSPPDVLLSVISGCELLFRLLTPHQQLEAMSEIVATLSSPALALSKRYG